MAEVTRYDGLPHPRVRRRLPKRCDRGRRLPAWCASGRPPAAPGPGGAPSAEAGAARADGGSLRVLVVDDEPSMRALCRVNLRAAGIEVLEAGDGEAALALAQAERPDLVLLDVMMPGLDGWEVARRLAAAKATRGIPVVFLSARAEPSDKLRGHEAGAVAYITKPFDVVTLSQRIESIVADVRAGESERLRSELVRGE